MGILPRMLSLAKTFIIKWTSWSALKFFFILPSVFLNGFINKGTIRDICRDFWPGSLDYHHCWRPHWPVSVTNLSPDLLLYSRYPTSQVVVGGPLALCSLSTLKMTYSRFGFLSLVIITPIPTILEYIYSTHTQKECIFQLTMTVIIQQADAHWIQCP